MKSPTLAQRVLAVVFATTLLALSGTMAWATIYEFTEREFVPSGVSVAGTDLSGMTEDEARDAIEASVSAPLMRTVTVTVDDKQFEFDPEGTVTVDVETMLESAYAPRRSAAFVSRLRHDVGALQLPNEVEPVYSVDASKVAEWVAQVAQKVEKPTVDATRVIEVNELTVRPSSEGRKLRQKEAKALLAKAFETEAALSQGERTVTVPVKRIKPKVTEKTLGKTIVVDLSQRRIRLYDGAKLEKTYPCAIGTPQFPTPKGEFEITLKRYLPTWVNPGSAWATSMPRAIPPGPGNPLGTRALNLDASGIRFHGTENIGSVGTAASHGCMRMYRFDIEDLYERVEVGTKVFIVE